MKMNFVQIAGAAAAALVLGGSAQAQQVQVQSNDAAQARATMEASMKAAARGQKVGMLTGKLFTEIKEPATRVSWLFFIGAILIVLGLSWGLFFPINKSLWTSSFVLYTAGIGMQLLAACHWLIDVHGANGLGLLEGLLRLRPIHIAELHVEV